MTVPERIERLRELLAEAPFVLPLQPDDDADASQVLICAAVNALPSLLAVADAAREVEAELRSRKSWTLNLLADKLAAAVRGMEGE